MAGYRIKIINKIAVEGLKLFGDNFTLAEEEKDPEGILVRSSEVDTDQFPSLLAVARAGAGVNNISVDKATEQGVCVFNTPGANANAVAELVFIMLGICARNIHFGIDFCRSLKGQSDEEISLQVEKKKSAFKGFELEGKTLGILGLGKIGVHVANHGIRHKMQVMGFDPLPAIENIHSMFPEVQFIRSQAEVVRNANILSVHMPYTKKTHQIINRSLLAQMPDDAILVNYARGAIINEMDVLDALDSGRLNSYITDFPSAAMLHHPRVLFSPHLGASTEESEEQCSTMAVKELKAYFEFGNVTRSVNFPTVESIPSDKVHTRLIMINKDVPGMIGFVSQTIGSKGINIVSYLNESNGTVGYNIIDCQNQVEESVLEEICEHKDVVRVRKIPFSTE